MAKSTRKPPPQTPTTQLRIIGGELRGRKFAYSGDPVTRPMKERIREAVFNLVGPAVKQTHAIDLFAGTGALALEAISRGATSATAMEKNFPQAQIIRDNARKLGIESRVNVLAGDTFVWARRGPQIGPEPLTIFCAPPYALYQLRGDDIHQLLTTLIKLAPVGSTVVVESDESYDFACLPHPDRWDRRVYPPAVIGVMRIDARQGEHDGCEEPE